MQQVFVLDRNKQPLMPCSPVRARHLLAIGRAVVVKRIPFTIRLKDRVLANSEVQSVRIKIDPGSKFTGIAILREDGTDGATALHFAEIRHRTDIKDRMDKRRAFRRRRRTANLRYRPPRFNNRTRQEGWLPPSLKSRLDNILSWVSHYRALIPIRAISMELAKFDTQKMQNPEISGVEYQRGELVGYDVWEYLLEKWGHKCAYCGSTNVPLEREHIIPKSRGGTNRVSNLTVACEKCNREKGNQTAEEFGYPHIQARTKQPLKDAAAINITRWACYKALASMELPVEVGTGAMTKYNRNRLGLPKAHHLDALAVGKSTPTVVKIVPDTLLIIRATGRGKYQRTVLNKYGFPRCRQKRQKYAHGIKTGDLVKANILTGKWAGSYIGAVVIRHVGNFKVKQANIVIAEGNPKYFRLLERSAGYEIEYQSKSLKGETYDTPR